MRYSHSRITTFENCPLKYKYQYIDRRVATLGTTIEAFMGNRVHEALEKLYRDLDMTRVMIVEELVDYYGTNWEKQWKDNIRIIKKEYTADEYRAKGRKCLEDYYRHYSPFDNGRTIGIEKKVGVDLGKGRMLGGIIDRLVSLDGGVYEIHDYKTSSNLPTQEKADGDRQLALYQIAVQSMWNDVEKTELVWHYLVFDKEIRSIRTQQELDELKAKVNRIIDTIEATREFNPRKSALCSWCEFRNVCPMWKHQYVAAALSSADFKEDDGVKLVDRFVQIADDERRLKAEKEKLRNALADFCAAFGYEVVFGTEKKIRVKKIKQLHFPYTKDVRRKELEDVLRAVGWWDEFSCLNMKKLEASLLKGELPEEITARLNPFCEETESVRLQPSKIKSEEK